MKIRSVPAGLLAIALAAVASGCGKTVKDVCDDLDNMCAEVTFNACVMNGSTLADTADANGCSDKFGEYLDCVDQAGCNWATTCSAQQQALEACTGPFPQ